MKEETAISIMYFPFSTVVEVTKIKRRAKKTGVEVKRSIIKIPRNLLKQITSKKTICFEFVVNASRLQIFLCIHLTQYKSVTVEEAKTTNQLRRFNNADKIRHENILRPFN
ncbi:hypothetical protein ACFE04_008310 [Oxalis oulophora]